MAPKMILAALAGLVLLGGQAMAETPPYEMIVVISSVTWKSPAATHVPMQSLEACTQAKKKVEDAVSATAVCVATGATENH